MGSLAPPRRLRIGVDVGGTNTDAVVLDLSEAHQPHRGVLASHKAPTTSPNVTDGIEAAVGSVLAQTNCAEEVSCLIIGTTHFLNAVVEHDSRRLAKVAVIRLSKSFTKDIPPFSDFPPSLAKLLNGYHGYVDGGLHIDGAQEAPIQEEQILRQCDEIEKLGLKAVVISGVFSPIDRHFHQEKRVRDIMQKRLGPDVDIVCSSDVSNIGLLERENASILNASILKFARRTIKGFRQAMKRLGLDCSLFISQNDGTVIDAAAAAELPIKTFSSGPTNSMRGLGGGSLIRQNGTEYSVGPDSVGYLLTSKAKIFGGDVLTATDIAVASGLDIGDRSKVSDISSEMVTGARQRMKKMLERVIDRLKLTPAPLPVILVGGGSIICPSELDGVSEVIVPRFHSVANAVGAGISRVCGTVDAICETGDKTLADLIENAKAEAIEKAVTAGADARTVRIVEVDSLPIPYVTGQIRIIVKAVGDLSIDFVSRSQKSLDEEETEILSLEMAKNDASDSVAETTRVDFDSYRPLIVKNKQGNPEWLVSQTDLAWLRDGCYILGCAGGGSPKAEYLKLRDQLRAGHTVRIIDSSSLGEKDLIYWGGMMGSPAVSIERLNSGECNQAFADLMELLGHESFDAVMGLEIGGANGLEPLLLGTSAAFDRPVIDGDWMGRAYPTYWQTTLAVHAPGQLTPCAIASGDGKTIIMTKYPDDEIVDRALRASCSEMGSRVGMAAKPTSTHHVRNFGVLNTLSLAWRVGRCVARAQQENKTHTVAEQIIEAVGGPSTARILFRGKIVGVERRLFKGHSYGEICIKQTLQEEEESQHDTPAVAEGGTLMIPFKNENIYAKHIAEDGGEKYIATVPDLISVIDSQTGLALGVPEFRYGLLVTVLGITCSPRWTETPRGLEYGGPVAFGYDIEYKPLGKYVEPKSVIAEYAV
ncbi:uncharacterized protein AB675_5173 [Cyphellophora attinorum]|uniref:Hydantoin utilization protein A n=1 Tax=Cyphellophora attinorum TaxID=1664694 RepID=A0A0N1HNV2_9EURO|nr:uncharacterized protein AB675_5173 [Phialophora attinorum]KPI39285.1 hypothetical protein AB675_5173 [Phialophora attinorum]